MICRSDLLVPIFQSSGRDEFFQHASTIFFTAQFVRSFFVAQKDSDCPLGELSFRWLLLASTLVADRDQDAQGTG